MNTENAKTIANPEQVYMITSTIEQVDKVLDKARRSGIRKGYSSGLTHGLLIGLAAGAVGLVALQHVSIEVQTVDPKPTPESD
mgnify:CR=1 FL=1